jgi:hypothetical protein
VRRAVCGRAVTRLFTLVRRQGRWVRGWRSLSGRRSSRAPRPAVTEEPVSPGRVPRPKSGPPDPAIGVLPPRRPRPRSMNLRPRAFDTGRRHASCGRAEVGLHRRRREGMPPRLWGSARIENALGSIGSCSSGRLPAFVRGDCERDLTGRFDQSILKDSEFVRRPPRISQGSGGQISEFYRDDLSTPKEDSMASRTSPSPFH